MQPYTTNREVNLGFGTLHELSNGMLVYNFNDDVALEKSDVELMIKVHTELANGIPRLVLVNTGQRMSISSEARAFDNIETRRKITRAEALVVNNIATRIGANFYYMIQRPPYPVKSFTSIEKGMNWLLKIDSNEL